MFKKKNDEDLLDLGALGYEDQNSKELRNIKAKNRHKDDQKQIHKFSENSLNKSNINEIQKQRYSSKDVQIMGMNRTQLIIAIIVVLTALIAICTAIIITVMKNKDKVDFNKNHYSTNDYTYMTDISSAAVSMNTTDEAYRVLINKQNRIDENYDIDSLLEEIDTKATGGYPGYYLQGAAKVAAEAMVAEMNMNLSGTQRVYITSAYRSYKKQESLYQRYIQNEMAKGLSEEEARKMAETYSAPPGASEHHSGLCVDLYAYCMSDLVNYSSEVEKGDGIGFAETDAYTWLCENAHKFGFILRYPEGKEEITGYQFESWHYRFVGIDLATKLHESGYTLEEYINQK